MKNILILGLGRFGSAMVKPLSELGNQVVVCDTDEEKINHVIEYAAGAKIGDCTSEKFISSLGVEDFDIVFVTIGENLQNSLVAVTLLKDHGAKCVYAKAGSDMHEKLLLRLGADKVVFPERDAGARIANIYGRESVFECIELMENHSIFEIKIPEEWVGKSVREVNVRHHYGANILGIKKAKDASLDPNVSPDYVFTSEGTVMLMGEVSRLKKLINR
ncbi:MAG: TrkA family potassium uptake protein [Ruminococcaceae bacterium]|nr:TrkA family potassium uptake protein [Oscillospiraceae bacterium]